MKFLKPNLIFIAVFIFSVVTFFAHTYFTKTAIYGDGRFYYAITRSIAKDSDIRFENEYKELGIGIDHTKTGYVWNMYPPGTSFFWLPGFHTIDGAVQTINLIPGINFDDSGYSMIYQSYVAISSMVLGILGLVLLYWLLRNYFSIKISLFAVLALFGTTNLLFYISVEQINSHAVSLFVSALFVYYFILYKPSTRSPTRYYFILGLIGGVAGLIRTQDTLILLLPIMQILSSLYKKIKVYFDTNALHPHFAKTSRGRPPLEKEKSKFLPLFKGELEGVALLTLGAFIAFLPQILFWHIIFGTIGSPYTQVGFNFLDPRIIQTLFNSQNGLVTMTPTILIAVMGMFYIFITSKNKVLQKITFYGLIYFFVQLYLISSWNSSIGGSYSIRTMVTTYPLLAFGYAEVIRRTSKHYSHRIILCSLLFLSFINSLSIIRYLLLY